jgi:hypothetical protein
MATTGEPDGHQRGAPMTAHGENPMAIDNVPAAPRNGQVLGRAVQGEPHARV